MQAVWTPIDFSWTYLDLQLTASSISTITLPIFEILLWFPPLLRLSNRATECTCHVRVLWLWWWLCSAPRALVCISWQMGFSAPLALPVMMSHVPVYQTGHTQLSPHLLLSQSPIPLSSVFIFLPLRHVRLPLPTCHTHRLSFLRSVPAVPAAPQERLRLYLQTQSSSVRVRMQPSDAAMTALQSAEGKPGLCWQHGALR